MLITEDVDNVNIKETFSMVEKNISLDVPPIGVLCWEEGQVERGLLQFEQLPGSSNCPESFEFPVKYCRVKGANVYTILESPCPNVLQTMIDEALKMQKQGVRAITTSCGFNAIFQKELADALDIPVFTSSLLQVPLVNQMLNKNQAVGIITAKKSALTKIHMKSVGITDDISIHIEGLEASDQWSKIFSSPDKEVNIARIESDVVEIACSMMERLDIGAFVLECTDIPPFSKAIRKATGRPVFDFGTLMKFVYLAI